MSLTTQYTTFLDLFTALQNAVRLTTGVTATENQAKRAINVALTDMHLGVDYKLPWAERNAVLRTQARYTTGTVTVNRGSTTLTGSGSTWNTNNDFSVANMRANGKIVINGSRVPYRIASVSSDTVATLSNAFTEESVSGGNYTYFEDEYDLASDFLRPIDAQQFSDEMSIELISRTEFRRRYPNNVVPGKPLTACIMDYAPVGNTTAVRRVRLAAPPSEFIQIPYSYITSNLAVTAAGVAGENMSGDTDEPIVPKRYRAAILYHALYHWYRDKKDDSRASDAKAEYVDLMSRIMQDQEVGGVRPQFRPRIQGYKRSAQTPYSGSGRGYRRAG